MPADIVEIITLPIRGFPIGGKNEWAGSQSRCRKNPDESHGSEI